MKILKISNLALSTIKDKFDTAEFERKIYASHIKNIKKAILDNKLVDNIITVHAKKKNGKYQVIDGQHRLCALKALFTERKMLSYTVYVRIVDDIEDREAYLAINRGKPLSAKDILKVYDDGKSPFFSELRQQCSHYGAKNKLSFAEALYAYGYAKSGCIYSKKEDVAKYVCDITNWECCRIAQCLGMVYASFGKDTSQYHYKAVIFRNIMRIFFDHYKEFTEGRKHFDKFLKKIANDKYLYANQAMRSVEAAEQIYYYLKSKVNSYLQLRE